MIANNRDGESWVLSILEFTVGDIHEDTCQHVAVKNDDVQVTVIKA